MTSSSSSSSAVLVAAGSLLVAAGIGYAGLVGFSGSKSSSSSDNAITEIDDDSASNKSEYITAQEVAKVFDTLFLEMQAVLSELMRRLQQMQMMGGQQIPEHQIKAILRVEMEKALAVKQKLILEQFDMDYDCLEEATWEFLEQEDQHPEVKKTVERFQKLWEAVADEPLVGWRPGKELPPIQEEPTLSPERTIEVAEKYFSALTENMRLLVNKLKAEGVNMREPAAQQRLQMEFAQSANDAGEAALEVNGVTMSQFENSVKEHGENPTVARALTMLQMKQQQDLMSIGAS